VITHGRVKRWADQFQEMKRLGIKIPCTWGHISNGRPFTNEDDFQLAMSRGVAGYLEDARVCPDTGSLLVRGNAPGVEVDSQGNLLAWTRGPDGKEVKTAIAEVSPAFDNWRDGAGRIWKDSLIHLALTPLPCVAGQKGFARLSTIRPEPRTATFLSTLTLLPLEKQQNLSTLPHRNDVITRMCRRALAEKFKFNCKQRLRTLVDRGVIDINQANAVWNEIRDEVGVRRLSTIGSTLHVRIDRLLTAWESTLPEEGPFGTSRPAGQLYATRSQRKTIKALVS
jgi:hypothetical protein